MSRRHQDICLVQTASSPTGGEGALITTESPPVRFRRGQRWYRVIDVLSHWIEAIPWWRRGAALSPRAIPMTFDGELAEHLVWRVTARAERRPRLAESAPGTYDLVYEPGSERWWLTRVWD